MSLRSKIKLFTDKIFMKFVMVGIVNTLIGTTIMFGFYNVFNLNYWIFENILLWGIRELKSIGV